MKRIGKMYPSSIIIHHSATEDNQSFSWASIWRYHTKELGWKDIGYHYGIENYSGDIEVLVGRMMTDKGAHCKQNHMNSKSLGVCFVGDFDKKEPPEKQWIEGVRLCASLCVISNIRPSSIFAHRDFANYKTCPGRMFDMGRFRSAVTKRIKIIKKEI